MKPCAVIIRICVKQNCPTIWQLHHQSLTKYHSCHSKFAKLQNPRNPSISRPSELDQDGVRRPGKRRNKEIGADAIRSDNRRRDPWLIRYHRLWNMYRRVTPIQFATATTANQIWSHHSVPLFTGGRPRSAHESRHDESTPTFHTVIATIVVRVYLCELRPPRDMCCGILHRTDVIIGVCNRLMYWQERRMWDEWLIKRGNHKAFIKWSND